MEGSVLRHFKEEMRTTLKIHALIAIPYVRTQLQHRLAVYGGIFDGRVRFGRNEKVERREGILDDSFKRPNVR